MSLSFTVGNVRPADESDITIFRNLIDNDDDWKTVFKKHQTVVMLKSTDNTSIQMIKVKINISELSADDMYDTLMDPAYRKIWDKNMVEGYDIGLVSQNTDIGYYSMRLFPPFKNRDFVTLRSWFKFDDEFVILNHSVFHSAAPLRSNCVRGLSYLSGFLVRRTGPTSCCFSFVTQSDPRGNFPAWAVNRGSQFVAPKSLAKLVCAAKLYQSWKMKNTPDFKPWMFPEQQTLQLINMEDVSEPTEFVCVEDITESFQSQDDIEKQMSDSRSLSEEGKLEPVLSSGSSDEPTESAHSPKVYDNYEAFSTADISCDEVTCRNVTPVEMIKSG